MTLTFDIAHASTVEFGLGREDHAGQVFVSLPVDLDVQSALREMAAATWQVIQREGGEPAQYDPGEKHASIEYLTLPLTHDYASLIRRLHDAANLPIESGALDDPQSVFCYFARMIDSKGRRLTALRRATQFKGVLKSRLVRFISDALKLIEDKVFKLDNDFDLLADSNTVHILRPSAFEFAGKLQEAVLAAVPETVAALSKELKFVDLSTIEAFAGTHPRAARYLASIRAQDTMKHIAKSLLKKLCKTTNVAIEERDGKITVQLGHEMGFLEVLDRRRYEVELIEGKPEQFKASSRQRLQNS